MYQIEMEGHEPMTVSAEEARKLARSWCDNFEMEHNLITEQTIKWLDRFTEAILVDGEIFAIEVE